jgi:mevalonate kinase
VSLPARGRAAGKIILLGEHAVVYGRPALAAGIGLGLEVEVTEGRGPLRCESDRPELLADERPARLVAEAAAAVGIPPRDLVVRVRSELPAGAGLGSSAALAVAVVRALAAAAGRVLGRDEMLALGRRLEGVFHGQSSGIDPAAAMSEGGLFRFTRGEPPDIVPLRAARDVPLVVGLGDETRSTGSAVGGLRARWEAEPTRYERLFDRVGAVVEEGTKAIAAGDLAALGQVFTQNQALLAELGVSAPGVERRVAAAHRAGALGAKLTGGGAGGAVIAVTPEPERVAAALEREGVRTLVVHVGRVVEGRAA